MNPTAHSLDEAAELCTLEQIEVPESIQSHGWLISIDLSSNTIRTVSGNIGQLFSDGAPAMVGQPANHWLDEGLLDECRTMADANTGFHFSSYVGQYNLGDFARIHDISAFIQSGLLHLEIEPALSRGRQVAMAAAIHRAVGSCANPNDLADFFRRITRAGKQLSGFARVMIYQFSHDGSGVVIDEEVDEGMEPWNGQRYPASDIPPQARALYVLNRLRVIPDVHYTPVPLVHDAPRAPLEMTYHALRSVSPIHRQYLKNMDVGASMSLSIVHGEQLWGMILFQNPTAISVPAELRAGMSLLSALASSVVSVWEARETASQQEKLHLLQRSLQQKVALGAEAQRALIANAIPNHGVLQVDLSCDRWAGDGLDGVDLHGLRKWLETRGDARVHSANDREWLQGTARENSPAGVLAIRLDRADHWLVLFRNAFDEEVRWAGIPSKRVEVTADGQVALSPRADFNEWKELRKGVNAPWTAWEIQAAHAACVIENTL